MSALNNRQKSDEIRQEMKDTAMAIFWTSIGFIAGIVIGLIAIVLLQIK